MGQKVHPKGFRIGIIEDWDSIWYAERGEYAARVSEDLRLRNFLKKNLFRAGISKIRIKRRANQIEIDIFTAKPGLVIGKGGREIAQLRDELARMTAKQVQINVAEEKNPEASAQLLSESIAAQIEKRVAYKRAMKQVITKALKAGAKGVKVMCKGRLGGAEIARSEWYRRGRVPLHTLRAKIDYGFTEAMTIYGKIGIKVWVYKGDVLGRGEAKELTAGTQPKTVETAMEM